MNKFEERLKALVDQMCKMILNLLCPLNVNKIKSDVGDEIKVLSELLFLLIVWSLYFETHVSTNPTDFGVVLHGVVHQANGFLLRSEPDVKKD